MQEFTCVWIDSRMQSNPLSIDSDHRLVKRNVIRIGIVGWL